MPHVHSVSIGVWVECGTWRENPYNNGISHFLEHMILKGSHKRDAQEVARSIERVGGNIDGFTSREFTGYWVKVPKDYLELAIDILSDILLNPAFRDEDIEKEKEVVIEEIRNVHDSPPELLGDLFVENLWEKSPLGFPILGKEEVIKSLTRQEIISFYKENYFSSPFIVSIAGDFSFSQALKTIKHYFENLEWGSLPSLPPPPDIRRKILFFPRPLEQVHFLVGTKGFSQRDRKRYAFLILENILGGGMSSRLFQKVREEKGLVYDIFSYHFSSRQAGFLAIYGGARKERAEEALKTILKELGRMREEKVKEEEVALTKEYVKGNILLGLETTYSRMNRLAHNEFYHRRILPVEEVIERIDKVKVREINQVIEEILKEEYLNVVILGPEETREKWKRIN